MLVADWIYLLQKARGFSFVPDEWRDRARSAVLCGFGRVGWPLFGEWLLSGVPVPIVAVADEDAYRARAPRHGVPFVSPPELARFDFDTLIVAQTNASSNAYRAVTEGWAGSARVVGPGGFVPFPDPGPVAYRPDPDPHAEGNGFPILDLMWRLSRIRVAGGEPDNWRKSIGSVVVCGSGEIVDRFVRMVETDRFLGRIAGIAADPGELDRFTAAGAEALVVPDPDQIDGFEEAAASSSWASDAPVIARQGVRIEEDDIVYNHRPERVRADQCRLVLDRMAAAGMRRIGLFPGGRHTQRVFPEIREHGRLEVVSVFDEADNAPASIDGVPVARPERAGEFDLDAVLVSSDSVEQRLYRRFREVAGDRLPAWCIYRVAWKSPTSANATSTGTPRR